MAYIASHQGKTTRVKIRESSPNQFQVDLGDRAYRVDFLEPSPTCSPCSSTAVPSRWTWTPRSTATGSRW